MDGTERGDGVIFTKSDVWVRTIIWYDHASKTAEYVCRFDNWSERTFQGHVSELKAHGGLAEIVDSAIEQRNA
jgi:hypothetical protein